MPDEFPNEGSPTDPNITEAPSHEPPTELPIAPPAPEQPIPVEPAPAPSTPVEPPPPAPQETAFAIPSPGPYSAIPPMSAPPTEFASNYPRAGLNIMGYLRPPGVYWDSLSTAFSMITSSVGPYVLSTLIFFGIGFACYLLFIPFLLGGMALGGGANLLSGKSTSLGAGYQLFMILPQAALQYILIFPMFGLIAVGVRHAQGHYPQVSDFFIPFKKFKTTAMAALLVSAPLMLISVITGLGQAVLGPILGMVVVFGSLILIFPVYLGLFPQLLLSGTAAIFGDRDPIDSAKLLYSRMGWQALMFGLLFIVAGMASGLGLIAFCVGILFTYPIFANVIAVHYIYNYPEDHAPAQPVAG